MRLTPFLAAAAIIIGLCQMSAPSSASAATRGPTSSPGRATPLRIRDKTGVVEVWMAERTRAAQRFVDASSTPHDPGYHHFVSAAGFTERFGPTPRQVRTVRSYLTAHGFTRVRASADDVYVTATAPASGNTGALTSPPRSVRHDILTVTGLAGPVSDADGADAAPAQRHSAAAPTFPTPPKVPCSHYWAQQTQPVTPRFDGLTEAADPICGYSATQVRAAYGQTMANTGRGKTIALVELGAPTDLPRTLADYARINGLPAPHPGQVRQEKVGSGGRCGNPGDREEQIDSEASYAMAPGARQLMIDGDSCLTGLTFDQHLFDALLAPLTGVGARAHPAVEVLATSVAGYQRSQTAIVNAIALRAAAEGVSLLSASQDSPGTHTVLDDPNLTLVGGTTLAIGADNQRLFETGWSDGYSARVGSSGFWPAVSYDIGGGGGASSDYREPAYQRGVVPAAMARTASGHLGRAVPDIAADADIVASPMEFGKIEPDPRTGRPTSYEPYATAGTSTATPLVAGMIADAEQGRSSFGLLNPLLYSLAGSSAYHATLPLTASDPQTDRAVELPAIVPGAGDTPVLGTELLQLDDQNPPFTTQVTTPGYDTMTGLGTPNGSAFIRGLRSGR